MKLIFDNIKKIRFFKIIKYNKNIQNKINLNINDYKLFSEEYTPIEIEITPAKYDYYYFSMRLISRKSSNYHFYVNNSNEEFKRPSGNLEDFKITKMKVIIDYQEKSFSKLFEDCDFIKTITFKNFLEKILQI